MVPAGYPHTPDTGQDIPTGYLHTPDTGQGTCIPLTLVRIQKEEVRGLKNILTNNRHTKPCDKQDYNLHVYNMRAANK